MIRAYAIGVAGSTQGVLLLLWGGLVSPLTPVVVTAMIAAGFVLHAAFAEWRIRTFAPRVRLEHIQRDRRLA